MKGSKAKMNKEKQIEKHDFCMNTNGSSSQSVSHYREENHTEEGSSFLSILMHLIEGKSLYKIQLI
jgi:hypothetical protein